MAGLRIVRRTVYVDSRRCRGCGVCSTVAVCRSPGRCIGCLACYWACPYQARRLKSELVEAKRVRIVVDGVEYVVHDRMTVAEALESIGYRFDRPGSKRPSLPCRTGGCWACAVVVNGSLEPACITPVRDGIRIETSTEDRTPLRIVHGPDPTPSVVRLHRGGR
jgi:pyruvate formate lyase activating enzyme